MTETFKVVNGDWALNASTGRPLLVADRTKLRQDIRENLTVATQPTGFGAGLEDRLGQDVDPFAFRIDISRRIRASINTLQRLQDQFLRSKRPASERILTVSSLVVTNVSLGGGTSKTGYSFVLKVTPVAGEVVNSAGVLAGGS